MVSRNWKVEIIRVSERINKQFNCRCGVCVCVGPYLGSVNEQMQRVVALHVGSLLYPRYTIGAVEASGSFLKRTIYRSMHRRLFHVSPISQVESSSDGRTTISPTNWNY